MEFLPYTTHQPQPQPIFHHPSFPHPQQMHEYPSYIDQHHRMYSMPRRASSMTNLNQLGLGAHIEKPNETKPRLSKQEVEILERQFQEQHKPTSNTKRQLAERFRVDVARINNWFQNRRAKAKQEKKQEEYGLRQASRAIPCSEPSSPDQWASDGLSSSENQFQSPDSQVAPYSLSSGLPPPATTSFNPQYEDPAAASRNSLQRSLYEAEAAAAKHVEFSTNDEYHEESADDHYATSMNFPQRAPMVDRARFPMPEVQPVLDFGYTEPMYSTESMFPMEQPMVLPEQVSDSFGCFVTSPPEQQQPQFHHVPMDNSMPTFPSQLLPGASDNSELTPRPFQAQDFIPAEVDIESQSPPEAMESRFKSPPPPADIAARRAKRRPAAIGTSALRDKSSTGPKTANIPRPLGSPSIAMRRVSSVNGSLNVLAGRVQKSGGYVPQRSPLQRHFSEGGMSFLEQNAQNIQQMPPMPVLSATWLNKPFAPPTPNSPREMLLQQQQEKLQQEGHITIEIKPEQEELKATSASPSGSEQSYMFNRQMPGCLTTTALNTNMASPPETPANPFAHHWGFEVPDEALLTPGFTTFPSEGIQMPQPHYVSPLTSSQPPTPAFGQFTGFPYVNASPVFDMPTDGSEAEFSNQYFGGSSSVSSFPTISSTNSSPEVSKNEKIYTFNNATQKDFE